MSPESLSSRSKQFTMSLSRAFSTGRVKSTAGGLVDDYFRKRKEDELYVGMRGQVRSVLNHIGFDIAMGVVLFVNFACVCIEADTRAQGNPTPAWVDALSQTCFFVFCFEWLCHAYVLRCRVFCSMGCNLDLVIVSTGLFEILVAHYLRDLESSSSSGWFRLLRILRLLRLLRVIKLFSVLKELKKLLQMLASCAKTLFWSFLLCLILSSIWAVVAVEYLHDMAVAVDAAGGFGNCDRCARAFQTVMGANLTLFQIVVAGDSWGAIAIPMIEYNPATAIIFIGAFISLVYGVLNLVLAVVVDTYAEMKKNDMSLLANELEEAEQSERTQLARMFRTMDRDMDDTITLNELLVSAEYHKMFQDWLRVLDIGSSDLRNLFDVIDADMSGAVSIEEFSSMMYRMKHGDNKTSIRLKKCMLHRLELTALRIEEELKTMTKDFQQSSRLTPDNTPSQGLESTPFFNAGIASSTSPGAELAETPTGLSTRGGEMHETSAGLSRNSLEDHGLNAHSGNEQSSVKKKKKPKSSKQNGFVRPISSGP
eukprot:TRINITY_DN12832_c0_g1_i2.p1 TRINITY_DN12832_c0_g1~~TRINITY_DN12832_c0_g1_i2.p1  ORF type:complete len:538 (-),score=43.78 TRINITY_DN12832_c0_g1_i2:182-1795(-)